MGLFDSLSDIEKITIIGCSLGDVDMEHFRQIRTSVKTDALWEFSFHTDSDKRRVEKVCEELEIDTGCVNTFKM